MTKRIKQQRRGKGTPRFRSPSHRFKTKLSLRYKEGELLRAQVVDLIDDPARNAPLMKVLYDDGVEHYLIAPEGIMVGDIIESGEHAKPTLGSTLPLSKIPDGYYIYCIEKIPGDGGKFARSAGAYGILLSREEGKVYVKMPTKKILEFKPNARAMIGIAAGAGIKEAPLVKAGKAYYKHKAKNDIWPKVRGVKMSAYNHPHGGKQHHEGKPTTVSRNAPPGAKVGHIAARRTGRRRR